MPQLEAGREQAIGEPAMVIACGLEADHDRPAMSRKSLNEAIMVRSGIEDCEPAAPLVAGSLDEHLVAVLGDVDCHQSGRSGCRIALGHGRSASSVCSATSL